MYHNSPEYKELKQLSARICTVCREMTAGMKEALLNKNEKAAEIVISQDEELNDYSLKSDELCGKIIALYWPRGSDMRYILSAIKTSADFERIGDHACNIYDSAREIHDKRLHLSDTAWREIAVLESVIQDIVDKTLRAFETQDMEQARKIEPLEQVVDDLVRSMRDRHIRRLQQGLLFPGKGAGEEGPVEPGTQIRVARDPIL